MALGTLTLSVTEGVQGRPFASVISGLTTGRVEVLPDGSPGFSVVNGILQSNGLPYPISTAVLREYDPGVGDGYRDTRIDIGAITEQDISDIAMRYRDVGRDVARAVAGGDRQADGSILYTIYAEDDLGARTRVPAPRSFDLTQGSIPSSLTFARSSTAIYRDSSGLFQSATSGAPAFTYGYSAGAWVRSGLYLTPALTNLAVYAFKVGSQWLAASSATAVAAPTLGLLDDGLIIASAGSTAARYQQATTKGTTLTSGTTYTGEAWFFFGSSNKARFYVTNPATPTAQQSYINIDPTGYVSKLSDAGAINFRGMEDMGNGLYRCWFSFVPNTTGEHRFGAGPHSSVAGETVGYYGTNVVAGTLAPGQPILTTGSTATKAASSLIASGRYDAGRFYTVRATFADGTTQDVNVQAGSGGTIDVPNSLNRPVIRKLDIMPVTAPIYVSEVGTTPRFTDPRTGITFKGQTAGLPHSLAIASNRGILTVRTEVRQGDQWPSDASRGNKERSEWLPDNDDPLFKFAFDTEYWLAFGVSVNEDRNSATGVRKHVIAQAHTTRDVDEAGALPPPWELAIEADGLLHLYTTSDPNAISSPVPVAVKRASVPFLRRPLTAEPHWHRFVVRMNFSKTGGGDLGVAMNSQWIFNGAVPMGYNDVVGHYQKLGSYITNGPNVTTRVVTHALIGLGTTSLASEITDPTPIYL